MNTPPPKVLIFPSRKVDALPEDVQLALAIIDGGVADFRRYIDGERKARTVSLDTSVAVASSIRAITRVLRDAHSTQLLADFLNAALLSTEAGRNSIYGKYTNDP